jgi:hypothetical protein
MKKVVGLFIIVVTKSRIPVIYFTRANLVNGAGLPASTFIASRGQRYEYQLCFLI